MAKEQCNYPSSLDNLVVERKAPNVVLGNDVDIIETAITQMQAEMRRVTTKTGAATLTSSEGGLILVSAAAPYTLGLPTAVGNNGLVYLVVKIDDNSNLITVDGDGTETINGSLTYTDLNYQWAYVAVKSDNVNWIVLYSSKDLKAHIGDTNDPHSVTKTQVGLSNVENLKVKLDGTQAPTVNNDVDEGYSVGSRWFDVTNDKEYICLDNTDGAAVWIETTSQGTTTFPGLTDTPANYTGAAKKLVKVNSGEDALEFGGAVLAQLFPSIYRRDIRWALKTPYTTAANRYTIQTPNKLSVDVDGTVYFIESQSDVDLSVEANWDTIATDYRVAANRAGKDFYIYACVPGSGDAPTIKLSVNSTVPTGYTSSNSRKIGGFHCLCVAVGTISGHTLTGFVAGDVLPASIWDLRHRAVSENEGMVYDEKSQVWVDIYLASGTGGSTVSVYGGTISDTRDWMDFVDDGGAVGKRMLTDIEFQLIATGSNEETNITGSSDPGTTGGHVDTASRRMISNIGVEDACGALNQWLSEQLAMYDDAVVAGWYDLPGDKGSLYRPVDTNDVKLVAGGHWSIGAACGSRCRFANRSRWITYSYLSCRFGAEPRKAE